ncbi:MAG: hypothetical protein JW716_04810 [Candidatus Aenigmarchaeota archaeon]|nr:hypothetical protein [Candidatus Aenigmarchaeota archaeon]
MKPFCERFSSEILPVVKAMVAKKMMEDYKLSQNRIADLLQLTQPAISQYKRSLRGSKFELLERDEDVLSLMEKLTKELANGEMSEDEKQLFYCRICRKIQENKIV